MPTVLKVKGYRFFFFSRIELNEIEKIIEEHYDEFIKAWEEYFGNRSN
jgi:hypothetical protein